MEHRLPKPRVAGSNPVARSVSRTLPQTYNQSNHTPKILLMQLDSKYSILMAIALSCALFPKSSSYIKGVENYQKNEYRKAIKYFTEFYKKSPSGDSTLMYLYNCYYKIGDIETSIKILEELARRKNPSEQIYISLFNYYRQHGLFYKVNQLILNMPLSVARKFDQRYLLTRRLCAEIIAGAITETEVKNPISYIMGKKLMNASPDGKFYEHDTLKVGTLILVLDSFLPAVIPEQIYVSKHIRANSYLLLPYSRLVSAGIISPEENIDPQMNASLTQTVRAICVIKSKGFLK